MALHLNDIPFTIDIGNFEASAKELMKIIRPEWQTEKIVTKVRDWFVLSSFAVSTAINLRSRVQVDENHLDAYTISFVNDASMDFSLSSQSFHQLSKQISSKVCNVSELCQKVRIISYPSEFDAVSNPQFAKCFKIVAVTAAGISALYPNSKKTLPFSLQINTEVPLGAGLGASASVSVAVSAALLLFFDIIPHSSRWSGTERELVNKWALLGETISHGNPSGLDNTTITYGGTVCFSKKTGMETILNLCRLRIMVVNTKVSKSTSEMVQCVAEFLKTRGEKVQERILSDIDGISTKARKILEGGEVDFQEFGKLIRENHSLLREMGASHEKIEAVVAMAEELGLSCKVTGAGGGGCCFVLLPGAGGDDVGKKLAKMLEEKGYGVFITEGNAFGAKAGYVS